MLNSTDRFALGAASRIVQVTGAALDIMAVYGKPCRHVRVYLTDPTAAATLTVRHYDDDANLENAVLTVKDGWDLAINLRNIVASSNVAAIQLSF